MITDNEWEGLCLLVEEWWPGEFTDVTATAWRLALDDFGAEKVLAALTARLALGGRFRPSLAEVFAQIRNDPDKPTFVEAYTAIFGTGGILRARTKVRKGSWEAGERGRLNDEAACQRAGELHRLIGGFVRDQGLDLLRSLNLEDEEWGGARRKLLADDWEEFLDKNEGREGAALAVGGRRGKLGKFDPLRALTEPGPQQLERAS